MLKPLFFLYKKENEKYRLIVIYSNVRSAINHMIYEDDNYSLTKNLTPEKRKKFHEHYFLKPLKIYNVLPFLDADKVFFFNEWRIIKTYSISQYEDLKAYDMSKKIQNFKDEENNK